MIGIGLYEEHNAGLAAVEGGRVRTYVEFERLTRVKNQAGWFPEYLTGLISELPLEEVVAICAPRPQAVADLLREQFGARIERDGMVRWGKQTILLLPQDGLHPQFHLLSMLVLPGVEPDVYAVLIFDAEQPRMGWVDLRQPLSVIPQIELFCPSTERWFNGELFANLFGKLFYGSRNLNHCGKLMGLGSWGSVRLNLVQFLEELAQEMFDPGGRTWQGYESSSSVTLRQRTLERFNADPWCHELSETLDLAASAQELFRHQLLEQVEQGMDRVRAEVQALGLPSPRALLYSGGCALSVVTNRELPRFTGLPLIAAPYAHDASQFLGAAVWASLQSSEREPVPLGRGWEGLPTHTTGRTDADEALLAELSFRGTNPREVARRLADGQLIALIRTCSEAGPRALGHRSILANPLTRNIRERLNDEVKLREWYRPFAAALIDPAFVEYFGEPPSYCARYMLDSFRVRPAFRALLSSVTSPDGYSRAQALDHRLDPWFHELLSEFGAITGHPILLNTSLNAPGRAISHDLQQAIEDCRVLGLDAAVVDNVLIEASDLQPRPIVDLTN
jgi:predicted NodU family carbamoyl transferase